MGQPAQQTLEIEDFLGLVTNADARQLPPGASPMLINACPIRLGELQVRQGLFELTFDNPDI